MGTRFRLWWQKARKPIDVIGFVVVLVAAIALIFVEVILFGTGFKGKTLWDWLQLLIIPVVLALGGYFFTYTISKNERKAADRHNQTEREIAQDNQREAALQEYIDKMSELLLHEKLRESQPEDEVRKIARVRTLTVLPRLDGKRKGTVLQFLHESGLIDKDKCIIDLNGADLSKANLNYANLNGANLNNTNLEEAEMFFANLNNADLNHANMTSAELSFVKLNLANLSFALLNNASLSHANLTGVDLSGAGLSDAYLEKVDLSKADLNGAYLSGANLDRANLSEAFVDVKRLEDKAKSLKYATMPDGSIHS